MSQWLASAIQRGEAVNDALSPLRSNSLALLKLQSWPTRKTEAWKYTSLRPIERLALAKGQGRDYQGPEIASLDALTLTFVDGVLVNDPATMTLPEGLKISALTDAAGAGVLFAKVKPARHLFGLVNDVLSQQGLLIEVAPTCNITPVIRVHHHYTEGVEGHTRIMLQLGDGASATILEDFSGQQQSFNTAVLEAQVGDNAELEHYRLALQTESAMSVGGCHFRLGNHSKLNSNMVGFGSELTRIDADVEHAGEFAFAKMNAIYLLKNKEVFDLHTTIEHAEPNGTTEENVRGIVGDQAVATFNGRIHIHRDAQKTMAELNNRNLLLSREAQINTKPELEIYADDVRCAHGATVAELDKKAMYYLQSRGVSRADALIMLNFGFINALVDDMPNEAIAEWLRPLLRQRFVQMEPQ